MSTPIWSQVPHGNDSDNCSRLECDAV